MKPLGEWVQDGNGLLVLKCGPLSVEVQQDWMDRLWRVRIPFWVYVNGRRREDMAELVKSMRWSGTRDEAMLLAEKMLTDAIAWSVREGSRMGLYGRKGAVREMKRRRAGRAA
jgi:hypothetical protein